MNSIKDDLLSQTLAPSAKRLQDRIASDEEREEKMKQEILDKIRVEITENMKEKKIEVRNEIIAILGVHIDDSLKERIQEIESNTISQTEMCDFFNKFNEFLNAFSHSEEYLKDSEAKGKLSNAADDLRKFCTRFLNK